MNLKIGHNLPLEVMWDTDCDALAVSGPLSGAMELASWGFRFFAYEFLPV